MFRIVATVIGAITIISSCITFPVISHTEKASTVTANSVSLSFGEYAREFFLSSRLGIHQNSILGIDFGISLYYSLPSSDFFCYIISPDLKISFLQKNQSKLATGFATTFLSLYSLKIQQTNFQALYYAIPIYMESEITEWLSFILNFRFFIPIFQSEAGNSNIYNNNFITINAGTSFFRIITLQGYLLASPLSENIFPIPGVQLSYEIKF